VKERRKKKSGLVVGFMGQFVGCKKLIFEHFEIGEDGLEE
jgi:hypothetical protein